MTNKLSNILDEAKTKVGLPDFQLDQLRFKVKAIKNILGISFAGNTIDEMFDFITEHSERLHEIINNKMLNSRDDTRQLLESCGNKMYKLGYDYLFLPTKDIEYKGNLIGAMSVDVLFTVKDGEGKELYFDSTNLDNQLLYDKNGKGFYLSEFILCSFDINEILSFRPNIKLLSTLNMDYSISFEVARYWKDISMNGDFFELQPTIITKGEFHEIMNMHGELFDNTNNRPAQTTAFFALEVVNGD